MADRLRVACVQLTSRGDKAANLEQAERLVARAAAGGADLVVLPEKWNAIGDADDVLHALAEPLEGGESVEAMSAWARAHGVALVGGSITERREGREKLSNTCLVFDRRRRDRRPSTGRSTCSTSRSAALVYRESEAEEPGDEPVVAEVEGWRLGLSVCYDLRFPELYRILALEGAELLTVPAHFTLVHRQGPLARAAAGPRDREPVLRRCGRADRRDAPGRPSYGRSLIADPWGIVLAEAPDEETVIVAELDRTRMLDVRRKLPSLASRQPDAYRWPAPALTLEAVLFDVDFTLVRPGPELGPEGYRRAGEPHGLALDPSRYDEARVAALETLAAHPELRHDDEIWVAFTERIVARHGRERAIARARSPMEIDARLGGVTRTSTSTRTSCRSSRSSAAAG